MTTLFPCPTCERHVREADRCPFCGAALAPPQAGSIEPKRGVRRAVMFAATAALTAGATIDCGTGVETQHSSSTATNTGGEGTTSTTGSTTNTGSTTASTTTASTTSMTTTSNTGGAGGASSSSSSSGNGTGGFFPPYGAPPV